MATPKEIVNGLAILATVIFVLSVVTDAEAGDYRIGIMPNSHHFTNSENEYNESHQGIIGEMRYQEGWIGGITFKNSFGDRSHALYWGDDWYERKYFSFGYQLGAVTGYDAMTIMPYAGLTFTWHLGDLKARQAATVGVIGYQYLYEFGGN